MSRVEDFIFDYGLLAVFVGAMVESDVTLLLAGVAIHLGLFAAIPAATVATAGMVLVDTGLFLVGRQGAERARRTAAYRRAAPMVERLVGRAGPFQILLARAVWGTRLATMIFWGVHGLPLWHLVALNTVGCFVWAGVLLTVGYHASGSATLLLGKVEAAERWLAVGALLAVVGVVAAHRIARARRARAAAAPHPAVDPRPVSVGDGGRRPPGS